MSNPVMFLMFGYPGAGKTTVAKLIGEHTGAVHLSSDLIRLELFPEPAYTQEEHDAVYGELDKRAEMLLSQGKSVVYDANLNRYMHRLEKYALCERTAARAILLWVKAPKEMARARAVLRGHHRLVPKDETFESMFERVSATLEEPREDEPLYTLDGTNLDKNALLELLDRL
jgi:predicted kinase